VDISAPWVYDREAVIDPFTGEKYLPDGIADDLIDGLDGNAKKGLRFTLVELLQRVEATAQSRLHATATSSEPELEA